MPKRRPRLHWLPAVLGVSLALAVPPALHAQDTDSLKITTDLGFVNASGNTDVTTFNVGEEVLGRFGSWGLKQTFGVVYGRTDGVVSTSLWRAGVRGDRAVGGRVGVYVIGAFDRNTFAGVARRFEEGAGLVVRPLDSPANRLEFEGGLGYTQQRSTTDVRDTFASARAAGTYRRSFSEASHAQLTTEFLPNLEESEDYRVNGAAEVVAPLAQSLAFKVSYVVRFDNLPEPTFQKTDRIFTVGLQITF